MLEMRARRQTLLTGGLVAVVVAALGVVVMAWTPDERTRSSQSGTPKAPPQDVVAGPPAGAGPPTDAGPPAASVRPVAPGSAGLRAFIDPETGTLTDTPPGDRPQLGRRPIDRDRNTRGLVQRPLSNGGVAVDLQGRFHTSLVATVNADGTVTTRCLQHPDALGSHDHSHETDAEAGVEDPS